MRATRALSVGVMMGAALSSGHAIGWGAASDFTLANNPNEVWTYGYWNGGFVTSPSSAPNTPFDWWMTSSGTPSVGRNGTTYRAYGIEPGHLSLECDFLQPVLRFTAPYSGDFEIHLQTGGTTAWENGGFGNNWVAYSELYVNNASTTEISFTNNVKTWHIAALTLAAGDTVDARMTQHTGGGNTDTMMTVNPVPEPATLMTVIGLCGLLLARKRRV